MFKKKTVFVLGAGASCEYGFPLGMDLKVEMLKLEKRQFLIEDYEQSFSFVDAISRVAQAQTENVREFLHKFSNAVSHGTIDDFLDTHTPDYDAIGKAAIALTFFSAEEEDRLKNREAWYATLLEVMRQGCKTLDDFRQNKISFITFNYERSLETFLANHIWASLRGVSHDKICDYLQSEMKVIHVHGTLGDPYYFKDSGVKYGTTLNMKILTNALNSIQAPHEMTGKKNAEIQELLTSADVIAFLGFNYHESNMKTLELGSDRTLSAELLGTSLGLMPEREMTIKEMYKMKMFGGRCQDFLRTSDLRKALS